MTLPTCNSCGDLLREGNRRMKSVSKKGKVYYLSCCKPCVTEHSAVLRELRKKHPQPPGGTPCDCCGRIEKLFLDHDHATKEFRGYICRNCNSSIGLLGDSREGLLRALVYLDKAEARSTDRSRSREIDKTHE